MPRILVVFLISFLYFLSPLLAHGDLSKQIERLTHLIKKDSTNAELYLKRGQLHAEHKDFINAKKDYQRARSLNAELLLTDLLLAQLLAEHNQLDSALHHILLFLKHQSDHPNALITRAGIYRKSGQLELCKKDLEKAMAVLEERTPGHFINIANAVLLADTSNVEEALGWLKKGEEHFGFDIVLKSKEVELFTLSNQFDAALRTVDTIMVHFPRKEKWLFEKALIYELAGEIDLARKECDETLIAVSALPHRIQKTSKMLELEARVHMKLEVLKE